MAWPAPPRSVLTSAWGAVSGRCGLTVQARVCLAYSNLASFDILASFRLPSRQTLLTFWRWYLAKDVKCENPL